MNFSPEVERNLWTSAGVSQISEIRGFPFPNYSALKAAVASGDAQLGIEYAAARELVGITKSKAANVLAIALSFVMPALAIGSVIVAFFTGNWWALGGILSSFLGQMFANPYNPAKRLGQLLVIAAILHLIVAQSVTDGLTWISFSFALSAIALWTLNHLAWNWAHQATLTSEAFAAYLFKTTNLHIRDKHGKIHDAHREAQS